jgi:formate dehydrogenase subunit delta
VNIHHLVKMVNEIAVFYQAYPDHAEAVNGVATHIRSFWEPRMRRAIIDYVHSGGAAELNDLAREAILSLSDGATAR